MSLAFLTPTRPDESVFGAVHLGYLVVESQRLTSWHRFAADAIGLHVDELSADALRFRLDDHACRFLVRRGPAEDLMAIGWQVDDHETFDRIVRRVVDRGVPVAEGTPDEAALRGVERLWRFAGPKGIVQELYTAPVPAAQPLRMLSSGWVTGESGLGHVALTSRDPLGIHRFYDTVLDSRLSDYIDENVGGMPLKIRFLRVNERHHSVAVAHVPGLRADPVRTRAQHVNIQSASLDDMLATYQRVRELGFRMAWSVGQHTNDRELSFYCVTPSGFELEVGWNPIVLTPELEQSWQVLTHQGISTWGHRPVDPGLLDRLGQIRQAALNARRPEITVPGLSTPAGAPR
ncbi:VOC family protein [Nocardioides daeguensis]|uniref:VOC family protein n=1 Tax=Nocardioides daeguensis TaxID=908359 RepID=A0ABP6UR15_9ACTN|nr:VOC family protein [Nocardioides daeguensis]MBV6728653.1 VOC family protein [Nocardioides daeguensis]MCR1773738.1 VOC family protein [Nocardioides daeguensis]